MYELVTRARSDKLVQKNIFLVTLIKLPPLKGHLNLERTHFMKNLPLDGTQ